MLQRDVKASYEKVSKTQVRISGNNCRKYILYGGRRRAVSYSHRILLPLYSTRATIHYMLISVIAGTSITFALYTKQNDAMLLYD